MSYPVMNVAVPWSLCKSGFHKTPSFDTTLEPTAAGRGSGSLTLKPYATWAFELDLNLVAGGETVKYSVLQQFLGCFMACCGRAGLFLFTDPNDNTVDNGGEASNDQSLMLNVTPGAATPMGTVGDGVSTQFQLARSVDQGIDILQNVSGVVAFVNGVPASVSINSTGVVTFTTVPPINAVLTWQGSFQYLCRFSDDNLKDLARVNKNSGGFLWSCGSVAFESEFV